MGLDTGARLFHTLHDLVADDFEDEGGHLRSRVTGSLPCMLHGNGNGCRVYKQLVARSIRDHAWPPHTSLNDTGVARFFPKYCTG